LYAFIFDSVGAGEWVVLLAVLLVVMGPKRLPETARKIGSYYSKFRRAADSFKRQLMDMDSEFSRAVDNASRDFADAARPPDEPSPASPSAETDGPMMADMPVEDPAGQTSEESHDYGDQPDQKS